MQDRFKFRYFDKNKGIKEISLTNYYYTDLDCSKLMQSTGLRDKNGKLMYDGDIVKIWKFSKDLRGGDKRIIWNSARCGFRLYTIDKYKQGIDLYPQSMVNVTTIEVIGNIYENPELLKEED